MSDSFVRPNQLIPDCPEKVRVALAIYFLSVQHEARDGKGCIEGSSY